MFINKMTNDQRLTANDKSRRSKVKGQRSKSVILVMSLFLVLLLTTMVITFFFILDSDLKIARNYQYALKAKYTAEAGIETAIERLSNSSTLEGLILDNIQFPSGSDNYFKVFFENSYPFITLTSTGEVRDIAFKEGLVTFKKELKVQVMISGPPQPKPYKIRVDSWMEL